ncbi:protein SGT1 homolog [Pseudomyrmex gracilis]|uniref:protein SGT1 homolog n=1 Tax=Pseudomyrmex gracilis TaxID=219809 RepID=UPI000995D75C|nr:protein SGT1 homolog [Pseudomyrmex gracilis]
MDADDVATKTDCNKMPVPKIKHDWYQTDSHVIVTILAKNAGNVKVACENNALSVSAKLPSGNEYSLEIDLAHPIVNEQCAYKVLPSKIEIKLKKQDGIRWTVLEGVNVESNQKVKPIPREILEGQQPPKYPSSCKIYRDWDKLQKMIEKEATEEPEGEAAVNALFQKIYGSGSDDVRKAMNKSFIESGGTVLSTNWEEVKKDKVDRKPPDGMEWKSWNS